MLGTYSTRSATTNPTGKKRFEAGINGNAIKQSAQNEKEDTKHIKLKKINTYMTNNKCFYNLF